MIYYPYTDEIPYFAGTVEVADIVQNRAALTG